MRSETNDNTTLHVPRPTLLWLCLATEDIEDVPTDTHRWYLCMIVTERVGDSLYTTVYPTRGETMFFLDDLLASGDIIAVRKMRDVGVS